MGTPNEPLPDFSDVESGSSSDSMSEAEAEQQTYTVEKGDTLWKIASKFYGNGAKWKAIHEANSDTIKNADLIHPGQVLKIPQI